MKSADKNTSVFPQGDLSQTEAQRCKAGTPRSVTATIDRKGWKHVRLGDVCKLCRGVRVVRSQLSQGCYLVYQNSLIPLGHYDKYNAPAKTTFVIAAGSAGEIGYCDESFWAADDCFFLLPNESIISKFLYYSLTTQHQHISGLVRRGSVPRLARDIVGNLVLRLPDLSEQDEIVGALTSIDTHISALESLIAKYEAIKKATVNLLLKPKKNWQRVKLGEAFTFGNGYTPSKVVKEYWENGTIPWFRMEDIRTNGHILREAIQHITPQAVKGTGLFPAGSFILSTTATLGEYALLIADSLANQQFTFLIENVNRANQIDTMWFLQYLAVIGEWCRKTANAGGLLAVNMTDLYNYEVPIPSLPEQKRIVAILDSIDDTISGLKSQLAKTKDIKQGMMAHFFG